MHFSAVGQEAYLGHDFLQAIEKKTPPDAMVVVIKIKSIEGIRKKSGKLDPFIEMKLVPGDDCAGDQVQRTSMKSDEDQQVIYWEPAQRFQFVVTNKEISKIRFSLYKFNKRTAPEAMGDVHLFLNKAIIDPNDRKQQSMSFLDHENGQSYGKFTFDITYSTFHHEVNTQEQTVKEYQRWSPASGWGNVRNVHMFPTDPHAWMSEDGERWTRDDDIDKISVRMLPEGWMVQKGWTVPAIIGNPEGWQYALVRAVRNLVELHYFKFCESLCLHVMNLFLRILKVFLGSDSLKTIVRIINNTSSLLKLLE